MKKNAPRDGGLRRIFRDHLPDLFWVPIETWAVSGAGVPDSWYAAGDGVSGWIEYKRAPNRVTPEQAAFLSRCARMGVRARVAVLHPGRDGDELRLYDGGDAPELARGGYADPLVACRGTPARWDWALIRAALVA